MLSMNEMQSGRAHVILKTMIFSRTKIGGIMCKFSVKWYKNNGWLEYSVVTFIEQEFFKQVRDDDVITRFQSMKERVVKLY
jgi:hypothetical protein